ncbi:MAG: hypothetical protein GF388_11440 [Candidatus Aegiribacteria sp.]|nr:hypothetical protein [Candidatus Aegiribacteria sp.]
MMVLLSIITLLSGFPEESCTDYRFMSTCRYDGEWIETEDTWFGLFRTDSAFELREVELQLSRSTAPLYEGERPHPFVVELIGEPNWPLIVVSSSKTEFTEGPINTAFQGTQRLDSDTSFTLEAPGIEKTMLVLKDEGLFLSSDQIDQSISDTYPIESSGHFIEVVWAGDLDRDGMVDLIINDVDDGYLRFRWSLFLSSEADPDALLEKVATFCDVYY